MPWFELYINKEIPEAPKLIVNEDAEMFAVKNYLSCLLTTQWCDVTNIRRFNGEFFIPIEEELDFIVRQPHVAYRMMSNNKGEVTFVAETD